MQSSHIHSSYHQHSHIKTVTYSSAKHVPQASHSRFLSHFFLPASLGPTPIDSAGLMRPKITKAPSAAHASPVNKLKTIPHSLYDDPAFSADPSANPLCSASYNISSWVTDPPKGHPSITTRGAPTDVRNSEVTLIQPPNSPVYLDAQPQLRKSMTQPVTSLVVSPPSTSLPDLSLTASSASDSSLPTSVALSESRQSLTTRTDMSSVTTDNKKRIGFPFFRRKSLPTSTTNSHPTPNVSMLPSTAAQSKQLGSSSYIQPQVNRAINPINSATRDSKHSQAPRGYQPPAGKARELDMIDELDESNPLGIALHHGGPYEVIQKVVDSRTYPQQGLYNPSQPYFRFDVPLNLSPGQVLPHSVTPYYRPRGPPGPASNVQDRIDFGTQMRSPPGVTNRGAGPARRQSSVNHRPTNMDHPNPHDSRHDAALRPSNPHVLLEQIPQESRFEAPNSHHSTARVTPPSTKRNHSAIINNKPVLEDVRDGVANKDHVTQRAHPEQEQHAYVNGDLVNGSGDGQAPHMILTDGREAEERLRSPSHDSHSHLPAQHVLPPAIQDRQVLSSGPAPNRHVYESLDSGSSSLHSGASSVMTGMTTTASMSYRNRVLPKQLVMPSPLAKAAVSSRPQPTLPQNAQYWQNMARQHRIRFHDGTEYELPVTNSNAGHMVDTSPGLEASHRPTESPTRSTSVSHNGKLKKRPSVRGPEPPEIVARLAALPKVMQKSKYMEPPPTIPEYPRDNGPATKAPIVRRGMKRLLTKRMIS